MLPIRGRRDVLHQLVGLNAAVGEASGLRRRLLVLRRDELRRCFHAAYWQKGGA